MMKSEKEINEQRDVAEMQSNDETSPKHRRGGGKDDGMKKRYRIADGGGRSRMSRHVSQNAEVAVVTRGHH